MEMRLNYLFGVVLVVLVVSGCNFFSPEPEPSLYERLGGKSAIEEVIDDFVERVGMDKRITNQKVQDRMASIDQSVLKAHLVDQVCSATGGPCQYSGRDMKMAHEGLDITNEEFDHVVNDLVMTLTSFNVPQKEQEELLALLAPMRSDIVQAR